MSRGIDRYKDRFRDHRLRQAMKGTRIASGTNPKTRHSGPKGSRQNVDIGPVIEIGVQTAPPVAIDRF